MSKILFVGFKEEDVKEYTCDNIFIVFTEEETEDLTLQEKVFFMQRNTMQSDVIIANLNKNLNIDELYILLMANNNNIPIIGVGKNNKLPFTLHNHFAFLEGAIEHCSQYY
jgi:hypothetical protein